MPDIIDLISCAARLTKQNHVTVVSDNYPPSGYHAVNVLFGDHLQGYTSLSNLIAPLFYMVNSMNAREAWTATLGQLQVQLDRATYTTWLSRAEYVGYEDGRLVVSVPHAYARDWLMNNLAPALTEIFARFFGTSVSMQCVVWDAATLQPDVRDIFGWQTGGITADLYGNLNSDQTFDTFALTTANSDALLFSRFVLDSKLGEHPALYIAGEAGTGKTHLLQAIANELADRRLSIVCLNAEQFTTEFVAAVRHQDEMQKFRERYRSCDVLIVDEIDFLEGKDGSQQELRYTWDTLCRRKRLMVFAGRRLPRDLQVRPELRACLNRWLVSAINPADAESCMQILHLKATQTGIRLSESAQNAILTSINYDLPLLDGALSQVVNYARITGRALSAELVYGLLRGRGTAARSGAIDTRTVLRATADYYGVPVEILTGKGRSQAATQARHMAMHLCRILTDASLPQIGLLFGGRDHSTVAHGCAKIAEALAIDDGLRASANAITSVLRGETRAEISITEPEKLLLPVGKSNRVRVR